MKLKNIRKNNEKMEKLEIRKGGFRITFKNGYSIDIINGFGSYTDNHFNTDLLDNNKNIVSTNCEIAIIYENKLVNPFDWEDDVKGYVSINDLV